MMKKLHITVGDLFMIILFFALAVLSFFLMPRWLSASTSKIEILSENKVVGRYSLSQNKLVDVTGPLGVTRVAISSGRVSILSSPCPHKMCMKMGDFGSEGGCLACVPNEIIVRGEEENPEGLDAVTK
jgi:hypothetical protein